MSVRRCRARLWGSLSAHYPCRRTASRPAPSAGQAFAGICAEARHGGFGHAPARQTGFRCAIEGLRRRRKVKDNAEEIVMTATALQRANEKADAAKAGLSIIVPV